LDLPEGRERHLRVAARRTGEPVSPCQRVVHVKVVNRSADGENLLSEDAHVALTGDQYVISENMSYWASLWRPFRNDSSITKFTPTTSPPSCSTRPPIASTVPPVARTSSWMTTRVPGPIESAFTSSEFSPYSSM